MGPGEERRGQTYQTLQFDLLEMIEPLIGVVVFGICFLVICGVGCALCHCIPLLLVALGFTCCSSCRSGDRRAQRNGSYSPLTESEQGGHDVVEAEAYISPPLVMEVRDGVHIVQEGPSVTGVSPPQYEKRSRSGHMPTGSAYSYHVAPIGAGLLEEGGGGGDDLGTHAIQVRGLVDCGRFKDTLAAVVFIANVAIIVSLAIKAFALLAQIGTSNNISMDQIPPETLEAFEEGLPGVILAFGLVAFFATVVTSILYLTLLIKYSAQMITATIWGSIVFFTAASVVSILNGALIPAILTALFAGLAYWWLRASESRIAFASVILKTAVTAVKSNFCQLMTVSLFTQCLQLAYILAWLMAFLYFMVVHYHDYQVQGAAADSAGSSSSYDGGTMTVTRRLSDLVVTAQQHYHYDKHKHYNSSPDPAFQNQAYSDDDEDDRGVNGMGGFVIFLFVLSLYWGAQVCKNVVSSTVSGTLACWWFAPERRAIVAGAAFRSFTISFGSICLGSLLVSVVQTFKAMLEKMRDAAHRRREGRSPSAFLAGLFLGIMSCALNAIEAILEYMNRYALVYCAAYGTNFLTSGARVWALFKQRGWTQIINDNLIGNCLSIGVCASACLTSGFAYLCSYLFSQDLANGGVEKPRLALAAGGWVLGLVVGLLVSNMIESAVASVFVFFAEDPKELQRNHPAVHDELRAAWLTAHPASLNYYDGGRGGAVAVGSGGGGATVVEAHAVSDITGTASAPLAV